MDRGFAAWNSAVAATVETIGTHDFPRRLEAALKTIIDFDILMVFGYDGPVKPVCCYHNIDEHRARTVVDAYISGPYLLDPFYGAAMDKKIGGMRRLKDMAPDHFYSSEYYKQHYVRTGIRDEIGFVCRPANWAAVVVSFTRPTTAPAFGRRELALVRDAEPLLRVLGERHWRRDDPASGAPERLSSPQNPINETLSRMTDGILTPREIEITSLILRGHSNASISEKLKITAGTVKIHRKNIHQKLDISSQAELFGMFIQQLSSPK